MLDFIPYRLKKRLAELFKFKTFFVGIKAKGLIKKARTP